MTLQMELAVAKEELELMRKEIERLRGELEKLKRELECVKRDRDFYCLTATGRPYYDPRSRPL